VVQISIVYLLCKELISCRYFRGFGSYDFHISGDTMGRVGTIVWAL
jgi:hypothetical protein